MMQKKIFVIAVVALLGACEPGPPPDAFIVSTSGDGDAGGERQLEFPASDN